jgi:hypothetical protein
MGIAIAIKADSGVKQEAKFSITTPQNIKWSANWKGSGNDGNDFWISIGFLGNTADELVTNNVATNKSGTKFLNVGEYSIAIKTAAMGPGSYTVEFV